MNERIQELHEQAMKSCDEHRSDILNYHRIYREKFAELIVRECVNNMQNCDGDLDFAIWKTKKDFGVDQ